MTAIRALNNSLGRRIKTQWIKGHQDDKTAYEQLSDDAKLNVDADTLATNHATGSSNLPSSAIPYC